MTRETSIAAFYRAEESGIIKGLKLAVFKILCEHGPLTANEMRQYGDPNANSGVYSTRLSELQRMGAVKEVGKRPCATTGYEAVVWNITGDDPIKLPKERTKKEKIEEIASDVITLGEKLPMTYKEDLRKIYHMIKDL